MGAGTNGEKSYLEKQNPKKEEEGQPLKSDFLINACGLALVKYYEGLYLKSYQDSVDVWTIGYGRIYYDRARTKPVGPNETCTLEQAEKWLLEDLEDDGAHFVRSWKKGLNEDQFSALTSFCFNRGAGRLRQLLAMPGDIATNMLAFDWAGRESNKLLGLQRRRRSESALFNGLDWTIYKGWKP